MFVTGTSKQTRENYTDILNSQDNLVPEPSTESIFETVSDRPTSAIQLVFPKNKNNFKLNDDDCIQGPSTSSSYQSSYSNFDRSKHQNKMSWNDLSDDDCNGGPTAGPSQENIDKKFGSSQQPFKNSMSWSDSSDEDDCMILSTKSSQNSDQYYSKATSMQPSTSKHLNTSSDDDLPSFPMVKRLKESENKKNGKRIVLDLLKKYEDDTSGKSNLQNEYVVKGILSDRYHYMVWL